MQRKKEECFLSLRPCMTGREKEKEKIQTEWRNPDRKKTAEREKKKIRIIQNKHDTINSNSDER